MKTNDSNADDAAALALSCLGWTLNEGQRAERLLSLTGLTPSDLRSGLGNPRTLAAILAFLEAHEPDLIACAEALGVAPTQIVAARERLER